MPSGPTKRVLSQSSRPNRPPAGVKINTLTQQRTNVSDIVAASQIPPLGVGGFQYPGKSELSPNLCPPLAPCFRCRFGQNVNSWGTFEELLAHTIPVNAVFVKPYLYPSSTHPFGQTVTLLCYFCITIKKTPRSAKYPTLTPLLPNPLRPEWYTLGLLSGYRSKCPR